MMLPSFGSVNALVWQIPLALLGAGFLFVCAAALFAWLQSIRLRHMASDLRRRRRLHETYPHIFSKP